MKIDFLKIIGSWKDVYSSALTTVSKVADKEPSTNWKIFMLLSEHSPIRRLKISVRLSDLPYWVSVHLVRHKIGVEHFVSTQREDRTGAERGNQDAPVIHEMELDAQALINISRRRLCSLASDETRKAWELVVEEVFKEDKALAKACVPECIYRGYCYEAKSCGYYKTPGFQRALEFYREPVKKHRGE